MISSYGDQSTNRNNPSLLSCSLTPPQRFNASRDTLCSMLRNYNIRVTHREMVLLSIFFTRIRSTEGSSADCSLFILSLHALALHLAVKILASNLLYEDLSTLAHTSVGCICECQQDRTLLRNQYY